MDKIYVVYWSQSGNTQAMAEAVGAGITAAGKEAAVVDVSSVSTAELKNAKAFALGCPAMGAEVLEETEFDPFFTELESKISGLKVALFGSYGWGDGQWMRDWVQRTNDANAVIYTDEGLILNETPDDDGIAKCKEFGKGFAAF